MSVIGCAMLGLVVGATATGFDPRERVSACVLWLDGCDVDGDGKADTIGDQAPVSTWSDKSGQGHHATQTAAGQQPVCAKAASVGRPTVRFSGGQFMLNPFVYNWSEDWTVVVVASLSSQTKDNWRGIIGNRFGPGAANWWTLGTKSDGTLYLETAAGLGVFTNHPLKGAGPAMYSVVRQAGGMRLYKDGLCLGQAPAPNVGGRQNELRIGMWFGADQGWQGDIAEVLLYNRALSDTERKGVEVYLWSKWSELRKSLISQAGRTACERQGSLDRDQVPAGDTRWSELYDLAVQGRDRIAEARRKLDLVNLDALRRAIRDLSATHAERYAKGKEYLARADDWSRLLPGMREAIGKGEPEVFRQVDDLLAFQREALLTNPLLDFDQLLLVRRRVVPNQKSHGGHVDDPYGLPQNWQSNSSIRTDVWDNDIALLSPVGTGGKLKTLYKSDGNKFVGDVDLHFDGDRMLFSSIGSHGRWHVFEISADGSGLRQVTPTDDADVNYYDACYLPDDRILFTSTASMIAVPCVNGSSLVANLYRSDADGRNIRQICFDQEHDWCPTVLNNGRVLYTRWEYTDTPHSHTRLMFHMNPDGTGQMEYYGSNSYWPNSIFYARPIPGHPSKVIAVISGHHGVRRMGELVLFDPALGRNEANGAVQRIPGYGKKVEPLIEDNLVDGSWPKFLHPYPLSDKYFLVAAQPTADSLWGIYLVDVFDNMVLLREEPGYGLLEPVPFRRTVRPPVIPDRVKLGQKDATVYLVDVYAGEGLKGIPRGTVKSLRLFTYTYLYPNMGGPQGVVGMNGPWDIKRIIGTVPVREDGSAAFKVPANTPISVQPLDAEGKALQLMRSWFTAMPGEVVSCAGCHERQNTSWSVKRTVVATERASEVTPWHGPTRGFNFAREVQPVLDKYCVGCHDGGAGSAGAAKPDLRGTKRITDYASIYHNGGRDAGLFTVAYAELHRFVRRPGLESDYHLLVPMEYHADTTELVQMLAKGHHNVRLDGEAWDRLITWIDLNAPYHGTWTEIAGEARVKPYAQRRRELAKRYADVDDDPEFIPAVARTVITPVMPPPESGAAVPTVACPGWPFSAGEARQRQIAQGKYEEGIDLGDGIRLDLVLIPPGGYVMGDPAGCPDERPASRVRIDRAFWMGRFEVSNAMYAKFDPLHDSGVESRHSMQFGVRGFYVNGPGMPVVRVSWQRAMAFCQWLSARTGRRFSLPTEAQWEYACRAGAGTPLSYGDLNTDFSRNANLADLMLREYVCDSYRKDRVPFPNPGKYDDWIPKDTRFKDGGFLSDGIGRYQPNAWGLFDMHGNVCEWTRTTYVSYPYRPDDGRDGGSVEGKKVVRGGSWRDRPHRARAAFRLAYPSYERVFDVGFRVVCEP